MLRRFDINLEFDEQTRAMTTWWCILSDSWQKTRLMVIEEKYDSLVLRMTTFDSITDKLSSHGPLMIIILLELYWLLESSMCLPWSCSTIIRIQLIQLHRVHCLVHFEFD